MDIIEKIILTVATCSILLSGCNSPNAESQETLIDNTPEDIELKEELTGEKRLDELETEASRLRGGTFIENVSLNKGKAVISYIAGYGAYKEFKPQSNLTQEDYEGYWESGDAIQKALIDGSVRIMKKLDYIDQVNIVLPFKEKTYSIDVAKPELEEYLRSDFSEIIEKWDEKFSDPFVYTDKGRQMFFNRFGKVK